MQCRTCLQVKDMGSFYVSNGSRCKDCVKALATAHRVANIERVREYDRLRGSEPHRVEARKAYQKTDAFAKSHSEAARRWASLNPERRAANVALGNAVRRGKVLPWPVCAIPECCGEPQGHHPDYSKPLEVVWLCDTHHKQAHAETTALQMSAT